MRQAGSVIKKRKRYYVVYRTLEKKQKWEGGFGTKGEAQTRLTELLGQLQTRSYVEPSSMTLEQFGNLWLSGRVNIGGSTLATYDSYLKRHINPVLGSIQLRNIRHSTIQNLVAQLCQKKGSGKGEQTLSANTVGKILTMLKTLFKAAMKNGLIRVNPAEDVELPKIIRTQIHPPDKADVLKILQGATPETRAIIFLEVMTGLRRGEILALKWGDVDWMNQEALIQRAICKAKSTDGVHKYHYVLGTTKGRRARRVGLSPAVLENLLVLRGDSAADDSFIFTRDGSFIDPEYFSKWMALPLIRKATEGRTKRFHDLRHFFASMLIENGENPKYIQDQVGHASITTTFDIYGHLMPQAKQQASRKLERSLFGKKANVRTMLEQLPEKPISETVN